MDKMIGKTVTRMDFLTGNVTAAEERDLYDAGEISECEFEFGVHDDHSDCDRILDEMNYGASDAYDAYYGGYDREAEENMLGRPLFPNEY
jgi:hypothetical protein